MHIAFLRLLYVMYLEDITLNTLSFVDCSFIRSGAMSLLSVVMFKRQRV